MWANSPIFIPKRQEKMINTGDTQINSQTLLYITPCHFSISKEYIFYIARAATQRESSYEQLVSHEWVELAS